MPPRRRSCRAVRGFCRSEHRRRRRPPERGSGMLPERHRHGAPGRPRGALRPSAAGARGPWPRARGFRSPRTSQWSASAGPRGPGHRAPPLEVSGGAAPPVWQVGAARTPQSPEKRDLDDPEQQDRVRTHEPPRDNAARMPRYTWRTPSPPALRNQSWARRERPDSARGSRAPHAVHELVAVVEHVSRVRGPRPREDGEVRWRSQMDARSITGPAVSLARGAHGSALQRHP